MATAGIFLPAFFFVAVSDPLIPRLRRSQTAGAFLDGVDGNRIKSAAPGQPPLLETHSADVK